MSAVGLVVSPDDHRVGELVETCLCNKLRESGMRADPMREERRVVTALAADLVGSTALTERLDPEEARLVIGEAVARMVHAVEEFGGTVKDLAGDGILALFGAPTAHEDDAERALRAALSIVDEVREFARDVERSFAAAGLAVRAGVDTGPVVVGPVGGGSRVEYGATGDSVNVAARLQSAAEPSSVLVGPETKRLTEQRTTGRSTSSNDER